MEIDIHHLHTNTEPSHTGSLTASCSNWPGSGPYTHVSLSNQGSLLALHSSILFLLSTSLSFLWLCFSLPAIIEGFLLLLCGSSPSLVQAALERSITLILLHCFLPSAQNRATVTGFLFVLTASLSVSLTVVFTRQLSFLLFPSSCFPSHSVSLCFRLSPASVSLSEPVGSQTKRVSRGLERGIISLLLPLRSLSLTLHQSMSLSPTPPPSAHLLLLHHHHRINSFPLLSYISHLPSMCLSSSVISIMCTHTYSN